MTMQEYELDAYLGDAEVTDEQREQIRAAAGAVGARYPDPDLSDLRTEAFSGAVQVILGDRTLEGIGAAYARARALERAALATLTGAIIASAGPGVSEYDLQRRSGVTRPTIRKALGK